MAFAAYTFTSNLHIPDAHYVHNTSALSFGYKDKNNYKYIKKWNIQICFTFTKNLHNRCILCCGVHNIYAQKAVATKKKQLQIYGDVCNTYALSYGNKDKNKHIKKWNGKHEDEKENSGNTKLPKAQRTRGLSSYHRISIKHQLQNLNQTSPSRLNLKFKILTKPSFRISTNI